MISVHDEEKQSSVSINEAMHKCSPSLKPLPPLLPPTTTTPLLSRTHEFFSCVGFGFFFFSFCHYFSVQVFSYTANKEIRTDDLCLDVSKLNGPVTMLKCHHLKGNQLWEYDPVVSLLITCDVKSRQLLFFYEPMHQQTPLWDCYLTVKTGNKVRRIVFPLPLIHQVVSALINYLVSF